MAAFEVGTHYPVDVEEIESDLATPRKIRLPKFLGKIWIIIAALSGIRCFGNLTAEGVACFPGNEMDQPRLHILSGRRARGDLDNLEHGFVRHRRWQETPDRATSFDCIDYCLPIADYTHRSEEHTSELQSLMRISYAVF